MDGGIAQQSGKDIEAQTGNYYRADWKTIEQIN
jgi:hypothetical protein